MAKKTVNSDDHYSRSVEERVPIDFESEMGKLKEHPRTELLMKQNQVEEFDRALEAKKEVFKEKMTRLEEVRKSLENDEDRLQKEILKQNGHIQNNEEKRQKALRKIRDEHAIEEFKQKELESLVQTEAALQRQLAKQERKLQKLMKFAVYLDKVVDESEAYTEISDIIDRYTTLNTTYQDLLGLDTENQDTIGEKRREFSKLKERRGNESLSLTNEVAKLQTKLDELQQQNTKLESEWQHIQNTAAKQTLLLGQLKLGITSLYMLINKHLGSHRYVDNATFPQMLERIDIFIKDISDITSTYMQAESGSTSSLTLGARGGTKTSLTDPAP